MRDVGRPPTWQGQLTCASPTRGSRLCNSGMSARAVRDLKTTKVVLVLLRAIRATMCSDSLWVRCITWARRSCQVSGQSEWAEKARGRWNEGMSRRGGWSARVVTLLARWSIAPLRRTSVSKSSLCAYPRMLPRLQCIIVIADFLPHMPHAICWSVLSAGCLGHCTARHYVSPWTIGEQAQCSGCWLWHSPRSEPSALSASSGLLLGLLSLRCTSRNIIMFVGVASQSIAMWTGVPESNSCHKHYDVRNMSHLWHYWNNITNIIMFTASINLTYLWCILLRHRNQMTS